MNQTENKDDKQNDENDPYKFFKFAGPEDNKNNNNEKVDDEIQNQKRLATIKIISEMHKRYRKKKKKLFK